jgi:hypothetical protein
MTLNVTLLTERAIYQSADFRLTDADTGTVITDASTELVTLQYYEWDGFVTYTGVGRWRRRDISDWLVEWMTGLEDATPQDVAQLHRGPPNRGRKPPEASRDHRCALRQGRAVYRPGT